MAASSTPDGRDGRRDRWRVHREARRAELIAGVVAAVRERGATVGMDDVTAVSGIAKPVFYRYFTDKADLFRAVGRSIAEDVVDDVSAVLDPGVHPRQMLERGIDAFLRYIEDDSELYRFVLHPPLDKPSTDTVGDYGTVLGLRIASLIGDLLRASGGDAGAAEPWGFGIVGTVRSAGERWLEQRTMTREALTGYLTELLWSGAAGAWRSEASMTDADTKAVAAEQPLRVVGP